MSAYIILERISVQQANAVAGFTWGFPAVTNFLGFTHNLSRKLNEIDLIGCGVVSHNHQVHAYQASSEYADYEFIQTKNPADTKKQADKVNKGGSPSIIEEGKMHLTVSLVIEYEGVILGGENGLNEFKKQLETLCYQQRLAGGTIINIESIAIFSADTEKDIKKNNRRIKNILLPGFVLIDKNELLELHFKKIKSQKENAELVDAWLDFSSLKYKAEPILSNEETDPTDKTKAIWDIVKKEYSGYLVPIMSGYRAISDIYPVGEVENTRDNKTKTCFVEAVHSIAQWQGAHRLSDVSDSIWKYDFNDGYYLCKQKILSKPKEDVLSKNINAESFFKSF